jgi:DNA-binding NarL/FixJ family response regulator
MSKTLAAPGQPNHTAGRRKFPVFPTPGRARTCDYERMPRTVLVVDDDAGFRDLATRVLTSWGHAVIGEAGTLAEALEQAATLRPDTALVDIGLPDGDGFALTELLVAMPWDLRVVLISSDADRATIQAAQRVGADSFLPKDELSGAEMRRLVEGA